MKKRILSLILVCATLLTAIPMVFLPVAAADTFTPVTRFVLVSDIHVAKHNTTSAGANVDLMMNRLYAYLDEKGKVDVSKLQPITFDPVHHQYLVLGASAGRAFHDGLALK